MQNPYASPQSTPAPDLALEDQRRLRTHHARIAWLGFWNTFCGVAGLLLTAFVGVVGTNVSPIGLLLWLLFWLLRSLSGIGMIKSKTWGRWLAVPVHLLLCLSGVSLVVGGFGLWVLLSEQGARAFGPEGTMPSITPQHNPAMVILLALLVLLNWAVPLWILIFVLGPMV